MTAEPRPIVWKHRCAPNGQGGGFACDPPCPDPWQVDLAYPLTGDTFATFEDAIAWASAEATK